MKNFSKSEKKKDLIFLKKTLIKNHPNPFLYINESKFDERIEKIVIEKKMNNINSLGIEIMSLLALIRDTHTRLSFSDTFLDNKNYLLSFKKFRTGYYLTKSSRPYSKLFGSKLLGINNLNVSEIQRYLKVIIPQENLISTSYYFPKLLREPKILKYLGIIKEEVITLHLKKDGKGIEEKVTPEDYRTKKMLFQKDLNTSSVTKGKDIVYFITELPYLKSLYFQYNQCKEREDYKISNLIKDVGRTQHKRLIVDLRNNRGGDSTVLKPFIKNLEKQNVNLIILVGKDTYSSAILNLIELSKIKGSTTIGEIPHGSPTHFGEIKTFTLPISKLKGFTSTKIFEEKGYGLGELFKPEHIVNTKFDDYKRGIDTQIEYIRNNVWE